MTHKYNRIKYRGNSTSTFADEIIIGESPVLSSRFDDSILDFSSTARTNTPKKKESAFQNYMLSYSVLSLFLVLGAFLFVKLINSTLINFSGSLASYFVIFYFSLFVAAIFLILRKKMLTLEVKDEILHIKSFPSLNKKIPINQLLRCEINTLKEGSFNFENRVHFSLHNNGNRYKQPLSSGITLQLLDGRHILIGSKKD